MLKTSHDLANDMVGTQKIQIMPGRQKYSPKIFNLNDVNISSKYATARLLHKEKLNDLKRLQCLLDLKGRAWVDTVVAQQKDLQDKGRHRMSEEDETDDPDNTYLDYCPLQWTANI